MREARAVSPSALAKYEKDRDEYYLIYLSDTRVKREPQSLPASVGSAFDAYVKAQLYDEVLGKKDIFEELFETQVEPQNRDFALEAGRHVMMSYIATNSFTYLTDLMENAAEEPQFEFDACTEVDGVPIAGKPDCRFVMESGLHVVLDWKVNGYCGKYATSPNKGYAYCQDGLHWPKPSRSNGQSHDLFQPMNFRGLEINEFYMEQFSIDWADQLSMYSWMMGEEVGSEDTVVCIDQIVAKPTDNKPLLRIANHRCRVSPTYQFSLLHRLKNMWESINNGHVFTELSEVDNEARIELLNERAKSMVSDGTPEGDFFAKCARGSANYVAR